MTACCWLCTTMVTLVFWIACTRSGCTCCHLHCLRCLQNAWATSWSKEKWNHERQPGWSCDFCVIMASKQAKIEFLSHISSIYSTPRCRCRAQTYTPEPRCHTPCTGGLVWAVRLWISCRGATMCLKCHACMPVCKMFNPCTIHLTPQPCEKPPRSGSAMLLDKNDSVCFSILQK